MPTLYKIQSLAFAPKAGNMSYTRLLDEKDMIRFAKDQLRHNKKIGMDIAIMQSDLNDYINAWSYLKNVGLGLSTIITDESEAKRIKDRY